MNFSTFASSLLSTQETPLFRTTLSGPAQQRQQGIVEEDILGRSYEEEEEDEHERREGRHPTESESEGDQSQRRQRLATHESTGPSVLGLSNVVPAFVSRLGGGTTKGGLQSKRGWKAYESLAVTKHFNRGDSSDVDSLGQSDSEEEDEDEGPLPGKFVSKLSSPLPSDPISLTQHPMDEPLMGRRTLYVYPGSGVASTSHEVHRDSIWIAVYGGCLAITFYLSIQAYLASPNPSRAKLPYPSLFSTTPLLLSLSLVSLFTSSVALSLLLLLRHALRPLLTLSIFIGPFLFALTGLIAFSASFGDSGVEGDRGWKLGMRVMALTCVLMSLVLGRASIKRRKELNRAVLVGELACQTIIHHPPLILLSLVLSFASTILSLPFLALITSLLSLSATSPKLASYGSTFVLFSYVWTLALLRGIGKATTSGVVGSYYFRGQSSDGVDEDSESTGEERPDVVTVSVTKAALARATGPSLGTILFSSLLTTILQTISTILRSFTRFLRQSSLPTFLAPLSYLIPICDFLAEWANWFNGYTTVYAALTGKGASDSAGDVARVLFANRGANIRDTTLLRLLLTLTLLPLTLLPSLVSFLMLSSSYLSPTSGGYAPTFAVLCLVVPGWTGRVVLGLVTDAVDTLFIATHLDAENEEKKCQQAVEAFGEGERDTLASGLV